MRYGLTKCKEATYGKKKQINSGGKAAQKDRSTQGDASTGRGEAESGRAQAATWQLVAFGVYIEEFFLNLR